MDPDRIFIEKYVPNAEGASYHAKWKQQNANEASQWAAFRDKVLAYKEGDATVALPTMASKYGKALVAAGELHMSVVDLGAVWHIPPNPDPDPDPNPDPLPPPPADAYYVTAYSNGLFTPPAVLLFSYGPNVSVPAGGVVGTPNDRVKVVTSPDGTGYAARFEIRDADPGWSTVLNPPVDKSEERSGSQQTWNQSGIGVGDIRWFTKRIWMPYNATEKFELASGGSKPFMSIMDLHTGSSTGWSGFQIGVQAFQRNRGLANLSMFMNIYGGNFPETTHFEEISLWKLYDGSGNRLMANYNRWIELVWGMRFAPDNTGWLEVWVDGVNIYPRKNRPTMWAGDPNMYHKHGLYRQTDASFLESGRSVLYYGRTMISMTKPA